MSIPTSGEEYSKLMEYLRKAQESAAMLSHLQGADGSVKSKALAQGWLTISEKLKGMIFLITGLATKGLQ